jgi:hypothetical protein
MKRKIAIGLVALSSLGAAARVLAQEPAVQATVPFEFTVGGKLLPADTYTITSKTGTILIRNGDMHFWAATVAVHGNNQTTDHSKLVFEKYGDKYFLREVQNPNVSDLNVSIPRSKLEKQVQVQEAKYGGVPEVVLVASR